MTLPSAAIIPFGVATSGLISTRMASLAIKTAKSFLTIAPISFGAVPITFLTMKSGRTVKDGST